MIGTEKGESILRKVVSLQQDYDAGYTDMHDR